MMVPTTPARDWTLVIVALENALASGTLTASYDGKSHTFVSTEDLMRRLAWVKRQQAQFLYPGYRSPGAGFATFNRGNR